MSQHVYNDEKACTSGMDNKVFYDHYNCKPLIHIIAHWEVSFI